MRYRTPPPVAEYMVDRSGWPTGPWDGEADRYEFRRGKFPCLIRRRARFGYWCGYVAVPDGHPWFGRDHDAISARVHGMLNYSGGCNAAAGICHEVAPGDPELVWWVGFDCGYQADVRPGVLALAAQSIDRYGRELPRGAVYRTAEWCKMETAMLADQAEGAWHSESINTPPTCFPAVRLKPGKWGR